MPQHLLDFSTPILIFSFYYSTMLSYDERPAPRHGSMPTSRTATKSTMMDLNTAAASQPKAHRHMWIITGPAGCGKTTVAQYLAKNLNVPYIEGDEVCHESREIIVASRRR